MFDAEAFILAGGRSSRMGRDKALLRLGEKTFVERISDALRSLVGERIKVVGARSAEASGGLPIVEDIYKERGALGGLHAAFAHAQREWVFVIACDLPFTTGKLLARLAALRENFEAVVPVQRDGRLQPLCAVYRRVPCLREAEKLIEVGELRPRVLLGQVRTRRVTPEEWSDLEGAEAFFVNVNTPEEFARAAEGGLNSAPPQRVV